MLRDFVFFTVNDFSKDDGGTVRMYGILNAIASTGKNVILISNATDYSNFHKDIKHVDLGRKISRFEKKYFQFLLGILPFFLVRVFTFFTIKNIRNKLLYHNLVDREMVFFEYMDNTIGYVLKKLHIVDDCINDIHGVASIEFKFKTNKNPLAKFINWIKYIVSMNLDKKVFKKAKGYIFVSESMKNYFHKIYPFVRNKESFIIRDGVSKLMCKQVVDTDLLVSLKKQFAIKSSTKVVFFAGDFKDLGGVVDLVEAFVLMQNRNKEKDFKLILIGDGECYNSVQEISSKNSMDDRIILVGRVLYSSLRTYQELANVIVCPDKKHPYSDMVPHIKYFDSLVSGKIVINGCFESVKEINKNESLSIDFEPSNILDLSQKLETCIQNDKDYTEKFKNNKTLICNSFTYDKFIENVK